MKRLWIGLAFITLFGGCTSSNVKQTFGLDNRAPDEFRVVSRPPLSVPPQFDLRPPGTEASPTQIPASEQAQSLLLDSGAKKPGKSAKDDKATSAETNFLEKAGADQADPNIKHDLTEQKLNQQMQREEESWWNKITTIPSNKEPVVKADVEAGRLKKNQEEGKPANEGVPAETGGGPISILKRWMGDE